LQEKQRAIQRKQLTTREKSKSTSKAAVDNNNNNNNNNKDQSKRTSHGNQHRTIDQHAKEAHIKFSTYQIQQIVRRINRSNQQIVRTIIS
jgi:hypothetical protein